MSRIYQTAHHEEHEGFEGVKQNRNNFTTKDTKRHEGVKTTENHFHHEGMKSMNDFKISIHLIVYQSCHLWLKTDSS